MNDVLGEIAHQMGVVPLLWLAVLRWRGVVRWKAFWWLAGAFSVSWVADTASHRVSPDLVGNIYSVSQAGLIGAVLLDREEAIAFIAVLVVAGLVSLGVRGVHGNEVLLTTVAWLGVTGITLRYPAIGRVRWSLLLSFGLAWVAWMAFVIEPTFAHLWTYQAVRAAGLGCFCYAALYPNPKFSLSRTVRAHTQWKPTLRETR